MLLKVTYTLWSLHEQAAEDISEPEQPESVSPAIDQKLLEPAYKVGDIISVMFTQKMDRQNSPNIRTDTVCISR